jgi:hypothetical protein
MLRNHPTRLVYNQRNEPIPIDIKIADLIEFLWNNGYETTNSCQDNYTFSEKTMKKEHFVWIEFENPFYATKFVKEYIGQEEYIDYELDKLYDVIDNWIININVDNYKEFIEEYDEFIDIIPLKLEFNTSVRFPKNKLKDVENAFINR